MRVRAHALPRAIAAGLEENEALLRRAATLRSQEIASAASSSGRPSAGPHFYPLCVTRLVLISVAPQCIGSYCQET